MHVLIVYTHPSENSFTCNVRDKFIATIKSAGHTYEISDLYKMNFNSDMSEQEYLRDSNYNKTLPLSTDVIQEQQKINGCDVVVFIYPVFWTEAPAKLVGWFDRVWTCGFAYGEERKMKKLKKAIFLVTSGHPIENLAIYGHLEAMKTVMLRDRIFDRAEATEFVVFDGMSKANPELRASNWDRHLRKVAEVGKNI
jgi:NAD(P)H dehydrogenase (quinone)